VTANQSINCKTPPAADTFKRLTDEQRAASLKATLASRQPGEDLWVFGYGSLIWNPGFDYVEKRLTSLRGYHRSLCLWSRINRGTPECPGLVFGLDRGGSCRGMAFRVPHANIPLTFDALWLREMGTGAYHPRWINADSEQGPITVLAFVINRQGAAYVSGLSHDEQVRIVMDAHGTYGSCVDYVMQTAQALLAEGVCDERLGALANEIQQKQKKSN
jgi:cation transport protein ChaC